MTMDRLTRRALRVGRQRASEVLEFREKALMEREKALKKRRTVETGAAVGPELLRAAGSAGTAGVLVAEGDSWFDYPWTDVLRLLEDSYGYDVESVAHKGDRVEEMAYGGGQLEELTRRLEKLIRRGTAPKAVLLSGGGNDVAGKEFGMLLNHAQSAVAGLNKQIVEGVIDERLRLAYVTILSSVTRVCEEKAGRTIPILLHGYDYPVPDGRGFLGGWWFLPGPWLEPGFREKGYEQLQERKELARALIDSFNEMLKGVAAVTGFSHVRYVDLRNTLSRGANYKKWWDNELHPTRVGFARVTDRIAKVLLRL